MTPSRKHAESPSLGVPRLTYDAPTPRHPSDRPVVGLTHETIRGLNSRYGDTYFVELQTKRNRTRYFGV